MLLLGSIATRDAHRTPERCTGLYFMCHRGMGTNAHKMRLECVRMSWNTKCKNAGRMHMRHWSRKGASWMHNRCTPRQRRVLALRMQHNAFKCAKMRCRCTKMRSEMHELNASLWTECRQNAKKNAKNAQKCTSQKRYQFVAKTVLIPRFRGKW